MACMFNSLRINRIIFFVVDYDGLHKTITELRSMLQEMDYMENNYAELKKADDNFTVRSQSVDR